MRGMIRALLICILAASRVRAQDSVQHATCRDPHPAPVCGAYFLFEYNGGLRLAGTTVTTAGITKDALRSWFAWDIGWMRNVSPTRAIGVAAAIGGSADGTRLAVRLKHRSWLQHDMVVDASTGPLMTMLEREGLAGQVPTAGWTGDVGVGRARIGLVTLGADVARQTGRIQFATHAGVRAESRAAALVSLGAVVGMIALIAALSDGGV